MRCRTLLQVQCRAFLDAAHARALTQLTGVLEREPWAAVPVAPEFQRVVDGLLARGASTGAAAPPQAPPASLTAAASNGVGDGRAPTSHGAAAPAGAAAAPGAGAAAPAPEPGGGADGVAPSRGGGAGAEGQTLDVGGRRFHAVGALLMLARLLGEHAALGDAAPGLAGELAHRVVELLNVRASLVFGFRACLVEAMLSILESLTTTAFQVCKSPGAGWGR